MKQDSQNFMSKLCKELNMLPETQVWILIKYIFIQLNVLE